MNTESAPTCLGHGLDEAVNYPKTYCGGHEFRCITMQYACVYGKAPWKLGGYLNEVKPGGLEVKPGGFEGV